MALPSGQLVKRPLKIYRATPPPPPRYSFTKRSLKYIQLARRGILAKKKPPAGRSPPPGSGKFASPSGRESPLILLCMLLLRTGFSDVSNSCRQWYLRMCLNNYQDIYRVVSKLLCRKSPGIPVRDRS